MADFEHDVIHFLDSYYPHDGHFQTVHSILDLTSLISCLFANGNRVTPLSLKRMGTFLLSCDLLKVTKVRCSNWEVRPLSQQQVEYAALDGRVVLDMVQESISLGVIRLMESKRSPSDVTPPCAPTPPSSSVCDAAAALSSLSLSSPSSSSSPENGDGVKYSLFPFAEKYFGSLFSSLDVYPSASKRAHKS